MRDSAPAHQVDRDACGAAAADSTGAFPERPRRRRHPPLRCPRPTTIRSRRTRAKHLCTAGRRIGRPGIKAEAALAAAAPDTLAGNRQDPPLTPAGRPPQG